MISNRWFTFWWSVYDADILRYGYWLGVCFYFRWPWEKLNEGDHFPHGFKIESDFLSHKELVLKGDLR